MKDICEQAKELFSRIYIGNQNGFNASHGWFCRFTKRARLSRRAPTHVIQQIRDNCIEELKLISKKSKLRERKLRSYES